MKVALCTPSLEGPFECWTQSIAKSAPLLREAGHDPFVEMEIGDAYISHARAELVYKALDKGAEAIVFIDHDLSWEPDALLRLINADADVVGGTYRFKKDEIEYMGRVVCGPDGKPNVAKLDKNETLLLKAACLPAGFLKITANAVDRFMAHYPELIFGKKYKPHVDLFNHGAHGGLWFGEDYAFCRRWNDMGESVWLIPDLDLTHHTRDKAYPGNYHQWLMSLPGGVNDPARQAA